MSETIPFSAEELLKTGLVVPSMKKELEEYIDARRAFDDLFGRGPGLDKLLGKIKDAGHRVNAARRDLREHADAAGTALAALEGKAVGPLGVILRAEPGRFEAVSRAFAAARGAAEGDPESDALPAALDELIDLLGRLHAERTGGRARSGPAPGNTRGLDLGLHLPHTRVRLPFSVWTSPSSSLSHGLATPRGVARRAGSSWQESSGFSS